MRLVDYIREVADTSRKARAATPGFAGGSAPDVEGATESPEVMLEKVRAAQVGRMHAAAWAMASDQRSAPGPMIWNT